MPRIKPQPQPVVKIYELQHISIEEEWVATWGETVSKTHAAKMLGVSRTKLYELIRAGALRLAPNGYVLVRAAARWAYSDARPVMSDEVIRRII